MAYVELGLILLINSTRLCCLTQVNLFSTKPGRFSGCRYGIRKVWHKLKQDGLPKLARCTVERLMKQLGIQGVWRGKGKITTKQRDDQDKPADLVKRNFTADAPNKLWVADFTYIKTKTG